MKSGFLLAAMILGFIPDYSGLLISFVGILISVSLVFVFRVYMLNKKYKGSVFNAFS
ncbi:MAG: hypothetical protein ACJA1V_000376 [Flavobacteriaceae bacterium]|jgi:hypothetical protein|tara:strand:- start:327 stop:497 length:171 start_codon:yes stop_codon:yes gene_type:complete